MRQQRIAMFVFAAVAVTIVVMLVGLPFEQFSWVDALASYVDEPVVIDMPAIPLLTDIDPASAPPVFVEETVSPVEASLPKDAALFAPAVAAPYVGEPSVVARGIVAAFDFIVFIDSRTSAAPFLLPIKACLKGEGALVFLAADQAPRVPAEMVLVATAYPGYTCTLLDRPGMLVLVER